MIQRAELKQRTVTSLILIASLVISYIYAPVWLISVIFAVILLLIITIEWPRFRLPWLVLLYPTVPGVLLIALNESDTRILFPLLFTTVASYDVGAYLVGSLVGRHKLCPSISPAKTWEGVCGGFLSAYAATKIFLNTHAYQPGFFGLLLFCFLLTSMATVGDLFESFLKRRAGIKDAGHFLPGHGGWLDRLDGVLGAVLIVYPLRHFFSALLGLTPWP